MPLDPATVAQVVEIGIKLYQFIDKVANKGEKGESLQPIMTQLHAIRGDINKLGETLRLAIDNAVDEIVGDIRLTQLAQLPDAHRAIVDYLRTHANPSPPSPPQRNDPNYVVARGKTSDVLTYFVNHAELAFMGGFIYAMNTRIEFVTGFDLCWFRNDPQYISEIRAGVNHLNTYISHIKLGIDQQVRMNERENVHFEQPEEPPFNKPIRIVDSVTFTVSGLGQTFWTKTVPPAQRVATRGQALGMRSQQSLAKQNEIMGPYDQIAATWNRLVANFASAAIQQALLPRGAVPTAVGTQALEVTALREIAPTPAQRSMLAGEDRGEDQLPRYALPLRDVLIAVLQSPEFQQRQERSLQNNDGRAVNFWFQKAFHRTPTGDELATLMNVLKQFGPKSFFACLGYSREYEERWGEGLPEREAVAEVSNAS
jgi:hypothetical protein